MASIGMLRIAAFATLFAIFVAIWHICKHLKNYTEPTYQRYIVRIIFMVPIYAMASFLSLAIAHDAIYFNSIRDVYEAWVIYNFLSLCLAWVGGPGVVVTSLGGRLLKPSWHLMTCCLPPLPLDGRFIRGCKQGCLQFVILKPILASISLAQYLMTKYEDHTETDNTYFYTTLVYTISYTLALGALILFYVACKDLLKPFKPLPKFILIKSVVFLTYWQSVIVAIMGNIGIVKTPQDAIDVQNFLICIEMAIAAIGHLYAFPVKPYAEANVGIFGGLTTSISHALNFNDVVNDTMHQFAPTYHDYVLYSDGTQEAPTKYSTQTFRPTSLEMTPVKITQDFSCAEASTSESSIILDRKELDVIEEGKSLQHNISNINFPSRSFPYDAHHSKNNISSAFHALNITSNVKSLHLSQSSSQPLDLLESEVCEKKSSNILITERQLSLQLKENRHNSFEDEASETTRLTSERRRSSHGVLLDEIDITGEQDEYEEGYIQR